MGGAAEVGEGGWMKGTVRMGCEGAVEEASSGKSPTLQEPGWGGGSGLSAEKSWIQLCGQGKLGFQACRDIAVDCQQQDTSLRVQQVLW